MREESENLRGRATVVIVSRCRGLRSCVAIDTEKTNLFDVCCSLEISVYVRTPHQTGNPAFACFCFSLLLFSVLIINSVVLQSHSFNKHVYSSGKKSRAHRRDRPVFGVRELFSISFPRRISGSSSWARKKSGVFPVVRRARSPLFAQRTSMGGAVGKNRQARGDADREMASTSEKRPPDYTDMQRPWEIDLVVADARHPEWEENLRLVPQLMCRSQDFM